MLPGGGWARSRWTSYTRHCRLSRERGAALLQADPLVAEGNTEFNQATLAFIPKKLPQRQGELEYFMPADVRPH